MSEPPELSEFELIRRMIEQLPAGGDQVKVGPGDDAAVTASDRPAVTTVDALVEAVHFTRPAFSPAAVGRKAVVVSLSDLAAMAAEPGEVYIALGLPPGITEGEWMELTAGVGEAARRWDVAVLGGDVTRAPVLTLTVTAVGYEPEGGRLVTRSGANAGEALVVTGELGGAAAALRVLAKGGGKVAASQGGPGSGEEPPQAAPDWLRRSGIGRPRTPEAAHDVIARQLDPTPRIAAGQALSKAGASAMIDVSDGVGADAVHLAAASGVRIEIDLERLPIQAGVAEIVGGERAALELAAGGGEDFELLASLPPDQLEEARAAVEDTGCAFTEVGRVTKGEGVTITDSAGEALEPSGYDHLRS